MAIGHQEVCSIARDGAEPTDSKSTYIFEDVDDKDVQTYLLGP